MAGGESNSRSSPPPLDQEHEPVLLVGEPSSRSAPPIASRRERRTGQAGPTALSLSATSDTDRSSSLAPACRPTQDRGRLGPGVSFCLQAAAWLRTIRLRSGPRCGSSGSTAQTSTPLVTSNCSAMPSTCVAWSSSKGTATPAGSTRGAPSRLPPDGVDQALDQMRPHVLKPDPANSSSPPGDGDTYGLHRVTAGQVSHESCDRSPHSPMIACRARASHSASALLGCQHHSAGPERPAGWASEARRYTLAPSMHLSGATTGRRAVGCPFRCRLIGAAARRLVTASAIHAKRQLATCCAALTVG